jgi:hypothetical protein
LINVYFYFSATDMPSNYEATSPCHHQAAVQFGQSSTGVCAKALTVSFDPNRAPEETQVCNGGDQGTILALDQ